MSSKEFDVIITSRSEGDRSGMSTETGKPNISTGSRVTTGGGVTKSKGVSASSGATIGIEMTASKDEVIVGGFSSSDDDLSRCNT